MWRARLWQRGRHIKVHLAANAETGEVVAVEVLAGCVHDLGALPTLIDGAGWEGFEGSWDDPPHQPYTGS